VKHFFVLISIKNNILKISVDKIQKYFVKILVRRCLFFLLLINKKCQNLQIEMVKKLLLSIKCLCKNTYFLKKKKKTISA